jgi:hypothetical protein
MTDFQSTSGQTAHFTTHLLCITGTKMRWKGEGGGRWEKKENIEITMLSVKSRFYV